MRLQPIVALCLFVLFRLPVSVQDTRFAFTVVDPAKAEINLHLRDGRDSLYRKLAPLVKELEANGREVLVAMNAGMFLGDRSPMGLYVEGGKKLKPLNRRTETTGNFYMQPNGVFAVRPDHTAFISTTEKFPVLAEVRCATQSGPMLVIGGAMNKQFTKGSTNVHVRNGVGIRKDGHLVFAISKEPVNFHDFAAFFLAQGCVDALYLDGFVSKAYMPAQGLRQLDGQLGPLISVRKR
jgi:uncharacterized protein YigE (DUF2233 family)